MNPNHNLIKICFFAAVLLTFPAVMQAQYIYTTTNGLVTITAYTGSGGAVTIPGTILVNGISLPVTGIGEGAFQLTPVTSITIPNSVTTIGDDAFEGSLLANITLGNSVTNIGNSAFTLTPLTSVTLPNSVTSIGDYAFEDDVLMSNATIGNSVTNIGQFAFSDCTALTAVYFYGNAPTEGEGVFELDNRVNLYYLAGFAIQPASETVVLAGASATFTAVANVLPTYQWQFSTNGATWSNLTDGSGFTGSQTGTLTISSTAISMSGTQFRVVATDIAGQFISTASMLSILTPVQLIYNLQILNDPAAVGSSIPTGISSGNIVGRYEDSNSIERGFLYNVASNTYSTINGPTGDGAELTGISGVNVVGNDQFGQGFLYNITTRTYSTPAVPFGYYGTSITGIANNYIVGFYVDIDWTAHGFLYNIVSQTYVTLNDPNATSGFDYNILGTETSGISGGNIVGSYYTNGGGGLFLYNATYQTFTNLYLPYGGVSLSGIDGDNIVGVNPGFLYNVAAQTYATIEDPAYAAIEPNGISGSNIVGYYYSTNGYVGVLGTPVESAVLNVTINGVGSLSTNYNGTSLQVGKSYSITATAGTGFVFTKWTGGTNLPFIVLTNGATVQFVMEPNLMLQANFTETNKPTVSITAPTAGQHLTNALATFIGTASDSWGVAGVWYQLNNGPWNESTTTNGWANWTTTVELMSGTNTLRAYAINLGGNLSATNSVSVVSSNSFRLQLNFVTTKPLAKNGLSFSLQLSPGLNGHIQVSTNLTSWTTLTNFVGTNVTLTFFDSTATNFSRRFYRAVIP